MATYKYDANGKLISVIKTSEDKAIEQGAGLIVLVIAILLLPFYPIFIVTMSI